MGILEAYLERELRPERDRAIVDAWEIGLPVRAIAEAAHVSAARVQQIVDEHAEKAGRRQDRSLNELLVTARAHAPAPTHRDVRRRVGRALVDAVEQLPRRGEAQAG